MQVYCLTDRTTGEVILVDGDTVQRLLGVEFGYVEWCIGEDGVFENGRWRVTNVRLARFLRISYFLFKFVRIVWV